VIRVRKTSKSCKCFAGGLEFFCPFYDLSTHKHIFSIWFQVWRVQFELIIYKEWKPWK
jgi:hypothetical protein